jgi:hypothetical protein
MWRIILVKMGIGMKKFLTFLTVVMVLISQAEVFAHKVPTVAILTDSEHRQGTTYLVCGAASDIIATDLINALNQTGRIKAPLLGETMSQITQKSIPLYHTTFFQEYKYNYNIDFVNLKRVAKNINADYLLVISSGLDVQSSFLKDTWWSKFEIAGHATVNPTYKLTTLMTLIDRKNYNIIWQDLYRRDISAHNYDLGIVQFSPSYAQLSKIKKYSKNVSEYVTAIVDKQVNPWILSPKKPKAVTFKNKFVNEGTKVPYPVVHGDVIKQNFNETKNNVQEYIDEKQKKRIQNIQLKQETKQEKIHNINRKEEQLFDSIRKEMEGFSNALPPPKDEHIIPAVEIIQPVLNKESKPVKPAVNKTPPQKVQPIKQTKPKQPDPAAGLPPELKEYKWNLKKVEP